MNILTGTITRVLETQVGTGKNGEWRKQSIIVRKENSTKEVCLDIWGDKIVEINAIDGQSISLIVDFESREFNGKWYTNIRALGFAPPTGSNDNFTNQQASQTNSSSMNAGWAGNNGSSAGTSNSVNNASITPAPTDLIGNSLDNEEIEDLPF